MAPDSARARDMLVLPLLLRARDVPERRDAARFRRRVVPVAVDPLR